MADGKGPEGQRGTGGAGPGNNGAEGAGGVLELDPKKAEADKKAAEAETEARQKEVAAKKAAELMHQKAEKIETTSAAQREALAKSNKALKENKDAAYQTSQQKVDWADHAPETSSIINGLIDGKIQGLFQDQKILGILKNTGFDTPPQNLTNVKAAVTILARKCAAAKGLEFASSYGDNNLSPALNRLDEISKRMGLPPSEFLKHLSDFIKGPADTHGLISADGTIDTEKLVQFLLINDFNGFLDKFEAFFTLEKGRAEAEAQVRLEEQMQKQGSNPDVAQMIREKYVGFTPTEFTLPSTPTDILAKLQEEVGKALKPEKMFPAIRTNVIQYITRAEAISTLKPNDTIRLEADGSFKKIDTPIKTPEIPPLPIKTDTPPPLPVAPAQPSSAEPPETSKFFLQAFDAFRKNDFGAGIILLIEGALGYLGLGGSGLSYSIAEWAGINKLSDKRLEMVNRWAKNEDIKDLANCVSFLKKGKVPDGNIDKLLEDKRMAKILEEKRKGDKSWGDFADERWDLPKLQDPDADVETLLKALRGKSTVKPPVSANPPLPTP